MSFCERGTKQSSLGSVVWKATATLEENSKWSYAGAEKTEEGEGLSGLERGRESRNLAFRSWCRELSLSRLREKVSFPACHLSPSLSRLVFVTK